MWTASTPSSWGQALRTEELDAPVKLRAWFYGPRVTTTRRWPSATALDHPFPTLGAVDVQAGVTASTTILHEKGNCTTSQCFPDGSVIAWNFVYGKNQC